MSPSRLEEPPVANPTIAVDDDDLSDSPVPPPPRGRKKPLRTYGKRSAQSMEGDGHPQKKQKLNEEATPQIAEPQPKPTPPSPKVLQKEPPKRGSIMSYFKPAPPSSRASSPPPPPPPAERALTPPPSSPPIAFGKARKRRLTTRPRIDRDDISTMPRGSGEQDGQEDGANTRDGDHNDRDQSLPPPSKSERGAERQPIPAEDTLGTLNGSSKQAAEGAGKKGKLGKRQTKERVQMTLSLAINPGPGFTVCKECEVLYNPLNEKDRKEHKKQHAAYVRAKLKSQTVGVGQVV